MNKIAAMKAKLSNEAREVLAGLGGEHIGYVVRMNPSVPLPTQRAVLAELYALGVTATNDGLTIMGSGVAAQLRAEAFDAAF